MKISVIIPTYNEISRLPRTLDEITPILKLSNYQYQIIVVDDNSNDGTLEYLREEMSVKKELELIVQPSRLGKGSALRRGCLAADGDFILYMDADHATPISEVFAFIDIINQNKYSIVCGVRIYQDEESFTRRIIGLSMQILTHLLVYSKPVSDSQCGFKVFKKDTAHLIFKLCRTNGGMIDVELFAIMQFYGIVPFYRGVDWNNKAGSKINVLKCILVDTIELLRIKYRLILRLYTHKVSDADQPWCN